MRHELHISHRKLGKPRKFRRHKLYAKFCQSVYTVVYRGGSLVQNEIGENIPQTIPDITNKYDKNYPNPIRAMLDTIGAKHSLSLAHDTIDVEDNAKYAALRGATRFFNIVDIWRIPIRDNMTENDIRIALADVNLPFFSCVDESGNIQGTECRNVPGSGQIPEHARPAARLRALFRDTERNHYEMEFIRFVYMQECQREVRLLRKGLTTITDYELCPYLELPTIGTMGEEMNNLSLQTLGKPLPETWKKPENIGKWRERYAEWTKFENVHLRNIKRNIGKIGNWRKENQKNPSVYNSLEWIESGRAQKAWNAALTRYNEWFLENEPMETEKPISVIPEKQRHYRYFSDLMPLTAQQREEWIKAFDIPLPELHDNTFQGIPSRKIELGKETVVAMGYNRVCPFPYSLDFGEYI